MQDITYRTNLHIYGYNSDMMKGLHLHNIYDAHGLREIAMKIASV